MEYEIKIGDLVEPVEEGDYVLEGEHVEILHDIEEAVDELVGREGRLFVLEGDLKLLAESKMKKYEVNGVGFYDTESVRRFVLEELEKGRKVYVR